MEKKIEYYEDGTTIKEVYFVDSNGIKQGPYEQYYPNGKTKRKGTYINDEETGNFEYYYESGQLYMKGSGHGGELHGPQILYYKNGQLMTKNSYTHAEMHGPYEEYYKNGALFKKGTSFLRKPLVALYTILCLVT